MCQHQTFQLDTNLTEPIVDRSQRVSYVLRVVFDLDLLDELKAFFERRGTKCLS